jgi:arylsulfatase A-like enzyme
MGLITFCSLLGLSCVSAKLTSPHILFIVADDLGWNDVGYYQNARSGANPNGLPTASKASGIYRTPIIDELSSEGVRLESYYVQPLCSPTRATFMTGRYPSHTGLGPDVICAGCHHSYGLPAREVLMPQKLKDAGYATHAIGKWHLGDCHEGYLPTSRGFDSFVGYLAGAESYYHHGGDFRNGTAKGGLPHCAGPDNKYSTLIYVEEASRIVSSHDASRPLFMYLAFQSVHNPYDPLPKSLVDVEKAYPEIKDDTRRIYAGMMQALDMAIGNVTQAFKRAGLWKDTLLVFTTDNGGIGPGNNYPLRGAKVHDWEGGIRGTSFVRGTDSSLAPVPQGQEVHQLMHSTDWLPTFCRLAGISSNGTLPLDGVDQWDVLSKGTKTKRDGIIHNFVPADFKPVKRNGKWVSPSCMKEIDGRVEDCHIFGIVGGALRKGDYKLVWTGESDVPGSNSPPGTRQAAPKGFTPSSHDVVPRANKNGLYVFDIANDPTESKNLADSMPSMLAELLQYRDEYARTAVVPDISWRWAFRDTTGHQEGTCLGPLQGSDYCPYGNEFDCFLRGSGLSGEDITKQAGVHSASSCQSKCVQERSCSWWVWSDGICSLKRNRGNLVKCVKCTYGPKTCPGQSGSIPELYEAEIFL